MARLVESRPKPLEQLTGKEAQIFRNAPSVEHHLDRIREILALMATLYGWQQYANPSDHPVFPLRMKQDAASLLVSLHEDAWRAACDLADTLPARIQNQRLVGGDGGEGDCSVKRGQ